MKWAPVSPRISCPDRLLDQSPVYQGGEEGASDFPLVPAQSLRPIWKDILDFCAKCFLSPYYHFGM